MLVLLSHIQNQFNKKVYFKMNIILIFNIIELFFLYYHLIITMYITYKILLYFKLIVVKNWLVK